MGEPIQFDPEQVERIKSTVKRHTEQYRPISPDVLTITDYLIKIDGQLQEIAGQINQINRTLKEKEKA